MFLAFDREPLGWVHPAYRRHRNVHPIVEWNNFVKPAMDTVDTLNQLLNLAQQEECIQGLQRSQPEQPSDKFEVKMDVQQFAPNELDVKMVDNCVTIEGKHEEKKDDHGFISRHFVRRYQLPEDVKPEMVTCNLSSDGILCISAPRMIDQKPVNERTVPINFTGKPSVEESDKEEANQSAPVGEKIEKADVTQTPPPPVRNAA